MHDLTPSTALQEPGPERLGQDTWSMRRDGEKRVLVRKRELPRLGLFNPSRAGNCPVNLEDLVGTRKTFVRPLLGGEEVTIEDTIEDQKTLQDRWTGETHFDLVPENVVKRLRVRKARGGKRKAETEPGQQKRLKEPHLRHPIAWQQHFVLWVPTRWTVSLFVVNLVRTDVLCRNVTYLEDTGDTTKTEMGRPSCTTSTRDDEGQQMEKKSTTMEHLQAAHLHDPQNPQIQRN